mgnify:CR=1 FL=1
MTTLLAASSLAAWLVLLLFRDRFWRADQRLGDHDPGAFPAVLAIVPARNEAATVDAALASLLAQDYPGRLDVVLVDDGSRDATAAIARGLAAEAPPGRRLRVVTAPPPPAGWSGKVAAQAAGLAAAEAPAPWLWLTDADIVHARHVLRRLTGEARAHAVSLVSVMVDLRIANRVERWLVPPFVLFFQLLYPFRAVNDPGRPIAAAAGGSILIERAALADAGGFAAIRDRSIDDVALAAAVKGSGRAIRLVLDHGSASLRGYDLAAFWRMVTRTAFVELDHSYGRLVMALAGLALLFVAPLALLAAPAPASWLAAAASTLGLVAVLPMLRWYGLHPLWALAFPPAAWAYMAMTLHAALDHARGRRQRWRGREIG